MEVTACGGLESYPYNTSLLYLYSILVQYLYGTSVQYVFEIRDDGWATDTNGITQ